MSFNAPFKVPLSQPGPSLLEPVPHTKTVSPSLPGSSSGSSSATPCLNNSKKGRNRGDSKPKKNNGNRSKQGPPKKVTPSFQLPQRRWKNLWKRANSIEAENMHLITPYVTLYLHAA